MDELKKEYILLFNGISEITIELEALIQRLKLLQQAAENCYLDGCERPKVNEETVLEEQPVQVNT